METIRFDSLRLNIGEHRLMHFGLEFIKPQNQPEAQKDKPKENTDTPKKTEEAKERAEQRKEAEAKDAKKDEKQLKDIEKKMESPDNKELMSKIEKSLKNLEGTDPRFQQQFQAALEAAGVKNLTVEVTARHRGGGIVKLKDKDTGKVVVGFLATNDGTAEHVKWEEQEKKADTPEDREKNEKALRQKWLGDVMKELKIDGKAVTLGDVEARLRSPVEQHGVYVKGQHVGDIAAGYKDGRAERDLTKYTAEFGVIDFKEKGFKEQIKSLEDQIKAKLEK